jgi:ankyrin repeat protein
LSSVASIDENAPDLNHASGSLNESPLCIAARMGNVEALRALLSSPHVNVVQTNSLGMSALFIAAKLNQVDAASAIIHAAYPNKDELVSMLNMRDKASGMTPLFCALILGHTKVVELLAPLSDLSVLCGKDSDGNLAPAILAAAAKNDYDTCALLLQAGANVDQCDQMGHTALAIAARHGYVELCELFVQHGAEIGHRSKKGRRTALQKAKKYKHSKVVELFERYGAGAGEVLV